MENSISTLLIIAITFWFLFLSFTMMITIRTRKNLAKLQDQHLMNLPSKNALTFLDTEILCFLILFQFILLLILELLFFFDILLYEQAIFLKNFVQLCIDNVVISILYPIYIILKTRKYLPRLWDEDSPLIVQNNDFYAVKMSQVSFE